MKTIVGAMLGAGLLASPAFAQSSSGAWNGLSDRFQIDTGYFGSAPTRSFATTGRKAPGTSAWRTTSAWTRT